MRVCVCSTMVPFTRGGAEIHVESLSRELEARGFDTVTVTLPFTTSSPLALVRNALAWRMLQVETAAGEEVDLVIATRFPSYLIPHSNKVVWLIHQFRQAYDLDGTPFGCFSREPDDRRVVSMIHAMDRRGLGEARAIWANSRNVAARLKRFNRLDSEPLYHPPKHDGAYRCEDFSDYVFAVGRLDRLKRFDLLLRAMACTETACRCRIAGAGPERERLEAMVADLGLGDRVDFVGWVGDEQLLDLYANAFAVFYAPFDEDYGYVTIEAFRSGKPVITAHDSGGVLEFVEDGVNGFVCPAGAPARLGRRIDELFQDRERARRLGAAGRERVAFIGWDRVIEKLTGRTRP